MPAVVTVVKEINLPRYATIQSKLASNRAEITTLTLADLDIDEKMIGLSGSPTKVDKIFSPPKRTSGVIIKNDDGRDSAIELFQEFKKTKII